MKHEKQTFTSTESQEGSGPNQPLGASVIRQCSFPNRPFMTFAAKSDRDVGNAPSCTNLLRGKAHVARTDRFV